MTLKKNDSSNNTGNSFDKNSPISETDLVDYFGYPIVRQEYAVIQALNNENRRTLPVKNDNYSFNPGVHISEGHVVKIFLFLGGKGNFIPESIGDLTHLTSLRCIGFENTLLPKSFKNLTSLKTLEISRSRLTSISESICQLKNLEVLHLTALDLKIIPPAIKNLKNLKELDLINTEAEELPAELGELTNLTRLIFNRDRSKDLSNTPPLEIPNSFSRLTKLNYLSLANCGITTIPSWIGDLTELTQLYLRENRITDLPESIGNLKNLTYLSLEKNEISRLPESIGKLSSLTGVHLGSNPLLSYLTNMDTPSLLRFYSKTIIELASRFINDEHSISKHEKKRLLHELTPEGRMLLENNLPSNHPFLEEITNQYFVLVGNFLNFTEEQKRKLYYQETGKQMIWGGRITDRYRKWESMKISLAQKKNQKRSKKGKPDPEFQILL
jgi:Leucine-rich repeat (LRR) protein